MSLDQLDAAVRIGAVGTLLLLAGLLLRDRRAAGRPAWLFAPLAVCLSGFLIGNTPAAPLRLSGLPGAVAHFASGLTVVFLWWFCLACFDRGFRPRGGVLAVGIAWAVLAAADRGLLGPAAADKGLSYLLVGLALGIVAHLVWRLAAEREGDLIQRRHDARITVAVLLGGQLLVDLSADLLFGFAWRPRAFALVQNAGIWGFSLWLAIRTLAVRPASLTFGEVDAAAPPMVRDGKLEDPLRRRLAGLVERERIFLEPDLTFADFAARMGAPARDVRRLVNHELGFDHFRTFLNHHRVAEARRLLADPQRSGDKLIALALDSGFASLASFNRVFRAAEGCAPSRYRETALARCRSGGTGGAPVAPFEERSALI